ncbi:hypothetical protein ACO0R3_000249 [Hanseniaspora guilliermondii]
MFKNLFNVASKRQPLFRVNKRFNSNAITAKKPITINRTLPDPLTAKKKNKPRKFAIGLLYIAGMYAGAELIFNNERSDNASVNNTLLELRRNKKFRDLLGNNIRLDGFIVPWIYGTLNQVKGNVDIYFYVIGTKNKRAKVFFKAEKQPDELNFNVVHWYFYLEDEPDIKYDIYNGDASKIPI